MTNVRKTWMRRLLMVFGLSVLAVSLSRARAEMTIPLMDKPPAIDGKIEPGEWARGAGFDGVASFQGRKLDRRRIRMYVGADETTIYVGILSQTPDEGPLTANVKRDTLKVVGDDAVEIYVCPTPDSPDRVDYQMLANSLDHVGWFIHTQGNPDEEVAWAGGWPRVSGVHDGFWHFECAIPLESMNTVDEGRKTTDGVWTINLCRDWHAYQFSSLTGGYPFSGMRFAFTKDPAPSARFEWESDPCFPPAKGSLIVENTFDTPLEVNASLLLTPSAMPERKQEKSLTLPPGAKESIAIALGESDPSQGYELTATVASADGEITFYERMVKWSRANEPYRWIVGKPKDAPELDFDFAYYPSRNKLRIRADLSGLSDDAKPTGVMGEIRTQVDKEVVKTVTFPIAEFVDRRCEKAFELPPLEGLYEIALNIEGENVPDVEMVKRFERKRFPWENNPMGRSTEVYPPFTPIEVDGKVLHTVLKEHAINDVGLWDQLTSTSDNTGIAKSILAEPMRYVATVAGQATPVQAQPMKIVSAEDHEVIAESEWQAGALHAKAKTTWDYDGTVRVDLTVLPSKGQAVDNLTLEIPFSADAATLIHANADNIRAPVAQRLPEGEGVVWDATKVKYGDFIRNFCPYVYLGNAVRGICWFAENDKNWGWDPETPNLDVVRRGDQVILRVHLINAPQEIDAPRTLTFGLLGAPVKPRLTAPEEDPNWWRYRYYKDQYELLGTDVNWLARGNCGSVYPAGKDMFLWEMLKRGTQEKLSSADINRVIEHGRQYFEPYGEGTVKSFIAHARLNLRRCYNRKMIFYYNPGTCPLFEEAETFKDEWNLGDLRRGPKSNSRGCYQVLPTESYIDYNLYWYARSFEIADNKGVYWDNFFFYKCYNTEMYDSVYRRPDGSVVPAAPIWAMRDLAKRTFVMMNERGMLPITFPHMTSFSPLPMLSFATVQYDWEWKYSQGDVQDRFTREYLQLATTGELAGVWAVLLDDQGKLAADPWTQRTFTAVRLLHELDGYGGFGRGWVQAHKENHKLAQPVLDIVEKEDTSAYRYWDERPLPVKTADPDIPAIVYS
ncbi:MAG: DUF6067 family protein, partial [Candidatus Pacebacteria bacterium]|nr:DUF6067 family protein [Candidatus Paceibacterota bacterium]